jgi:hypothetical protein
MPRPLQSLRLRQVIATTLRADDELTALGEPPLNSDPANIRVYGRRQPAELIWPFLRVNIMNEGPLRKGTEVRVTVHSFSKASFDDELEGINAAVQTALEDMVLDLSPAVKAFMIWIASQTVPDAAEADAWHGINSFAAAIG